MATRRRARKRRPVDELAAAEARLDAGVYGLCERCGRPIGLARLRASPTLRRCPRCAVRGGGVREPAWRGRSRLGLADRRAAPARDGAGRRGFEHSIANLYVVPLAIFVGRRLA
jgi:DksA/TraR C4-type zinc finger protein